MPASLPSVSTIPSLYRPPPAPKANEWNQYGCKWAGEPNPCAPMDPSDPGCGPGGSNPPAWATPIWDALFKAVDAGDPYGHLLSIHNNAYLYNYSRPWVTHFSLQHTHNKPKDLWRIYGLKPFMYDEVKYEGRLNQNWGSLSAPQMVDRFWWGVGAGAYVMHGEMLYKCPYWSDSAGKYCGQSVDKIAWFKDYMLNTTLHPPFEECEGDDDGYVHTLTCGHPNNTAQYLMFHFYNGHPNASGSFRYIYLPKGMKNRQDLLQPWEKMVTLIYKPYCTREGKCEEEEGTNAVGKNAVVLGKPPPLGGAPLGSHIYGPKRNLKYWEPVGITVDEDTLPHVLTFTDCMYKNACNRTENTEEDLRTVEVELQHRELLKTLGRSHV